MESGRITIDDMEINYRVRGSGPSALLLIHGAVGSLNDFKLQLDSGSQLDTNEFTIVALDLPGHGGSSIVEHMDPEPTREYFELCAEVAAKLMAELGHKTYSVGGWSDGARVAALLAIKRQSRVNSLLLWGFIPVMDEQSCYAIARTRDTSIWDPRVLDFYSSVYGEERFSDLWRKYVDFIVSTLELPDRFDIRDSLAQIKCPTLVLHGDSDPIVNFRDHVKPIEMQIYNSEVKQFKGIAHNIHQAIPSRFNRVLTTFVRSAVC